MIRTTIIEQYIGIRGSKKIIGHHGSIHLPIMRKVTFFLIFVLILHTGILSLRTIPILQQLGRYEPIQRTLSAIVVFVYLYFLIQFLNNYLDALISSERGVTIFRRDGFLQYSVQQFERHTIEMISFEQHNFGDRFWNKGTILIDLDHGVSFRIENIPSPQKVTQAIRSEKEQYTPRHPPQPSYLEDDNHVGEFQQTEKFEILVETLGEVIKDYMTRSGK